MNPKMAWLRKKAMALPLTPGVYIMKDKSGKIIYIGKAKALKNRVSQYFGSQNNHPPKVLQMVDNVDNFDYILTDSEFEALMLEASLIKQHTPKYNILLKDDKGYHYFMITSDKYRRLRAVHQKDDPNATYLGPYYSSFLVKSTVDESNKMFKLPTCNRRFETETKRSRPCLNYHIGNCMAPCAGKVSFREYNEAVDEAIAYIKSGASETVKQLTDKMMKAADKLDFETAAKLRDKINAIKQINEKQKVVSTDVPDQYIFAHSRSITKQCFEMFRFEKGSLVDSRHFVAETTGDENQSICDFFLQFFDAPNIILPRISLDAPFADMELIAQWLSDKAGRKVSLVVPQKGEQKRLTELCRKNAEEHLLQSGENIIRHNSGMKQLAELLGLKSPIGRIESYDISNTSGSENVGAMIVFINGVKSPQNYRKFKIKGFIGQDDYRSMREVIERRFNHYLNPDETDASFKQKPDLILLDGGKGQLSVVEELLKEMKINVPVYGMVKDSHHRTRAIAADGGELELKSSAEAFRFVTGIQDEVHRFAITYHRSRRKAASLDSSLLAIEGVGEKRAASLLKHFKTMKAIKNAEVEELCKADGINKDTAENIYNYFKFMDD